MPESLAPRLLAPRPCGDDRAFSQFWEALPGGLWAPLPQSFLSGEWLSSLLSEIEPTLYQPCPRALAKRAIREKARPLTLPLCSLRCHPCLWAL